MASRGPSRLRPILQRFDVGDGVPHGLEVLHLVVRDLDAELLLGGHHDLDHGQRVDVEVVGEGLLLGHVGPGHAGDLFEDLGEAGEDLLSVMAIAWFSFLWWCGRPAGVRPAGRGGSGQRMTCPA